MRPSAVGKLSREKERKKERARVVKRTNSRKQLYEKKEEEEEEEGTQRGVNKVNFDVVPFERRLSRTG